MLNIDHHVSNTGFGSRRLIEGTACATAEIVYRLIRRMGVCIDRDIATCIYTGILTDDGVVPLREHQRRLVRHQPRDDRARVEPHEVARHVYGSTRFGRIKLLNLALNSIEISPNGKLSLMTVTRGMMEETQTQAEDADGLTINYARRIEDVRVAALIQEQVNGRSPAGAPGSSTSACARTARWTWRRSPAPTGRASRRGRLPDRGHARGHRVAADGLGGADVGGR